MTKEAGEDVVSASTIETAQPTKRSDLVETLRRLAEVSGRSLGSILGDYAKGAFGPGKLNLDEFLALGLYDPARYAGSDLRSFVGLKAMRSIWYQANFRLEFYDLIRNKISMTAMLEAHGFPAIPILALFCTSAGYEVREMPAFRRDVDALPDRCRALSDVRKAGEWLSEPRLGQFPAL